MGTKLLDTDVTSYHSSSMERFAQQIANRPQIGDLVEAPVIGIEKMALYVDLKPYGTGVIYGREFLNARDVIKKINIGDIISAKVVEAETPEDGYVGLSLKEARQALVWAEAENLIKNKTVLEIPVKDANKGGLIMEWQGIAGFLPASQLKPEHYPRVQDGDKDRILDELRKLVGTRLAVSIIGAFPKEGKLIFSEKNSQEKERAVTATKYKVNDELDGKVTGMVDFGICHHCR